ncbi:MAG: hypothetical protein DRN25_03555 [Thermoplasmata archaeon]|nr:MAG: hypothetical protein DRN25_03555 [Thermoplasmata archaeon]
MLKYAPSRLGMRYTKEYANNLKFLAYAVINVKNPNNTELPTKLRKIMPLIIPSTIDMIIKLCEGA